MGVAVDYHEFESGHYISDFNVGVLVSVAEGARWRRSSQARRLSSSRHRVGQPQCVNTLNEQLGSGSNWRRSGSPTFARLHP